MNLVSLLLLQTAFAAEIVVDGSGAGDHATLQEAIDASESGDTIMVMPGTYTENILVEGKSVNIQGEEETSRDTTILVGTGDGTVATLAGGAVNFQNLTVSGGTQGVAITSSAVATLSNLAIQDNMGALSGGGVYISSNSDVKLMDLLIQNNSADQGGGVHVAADAKLVEISGSTISDNDALEGGGGIYTAAAISVSDSWIAGNSTTGSGGGLYATIIAPSVDNSDFWGNSADYGGAIAIEATTSGSFFANSIKNTEMWLNSAESDGGAVWLNGAGIYYLNKDLLVLNSAGGDGGGIWTTGGQPNLTFVRAWHNEAAGNGGGAILNASNGGQTRRSSFGGNVAMGIGGGVMHSSTNGTHQVVSNRYIENSASSGGGLVIESDSAKKNVITNVDIVGNTGGGVAFVDSSSAKIENSIVAWNTGTGIAADETSSGAALRVKYNNVYANDTDYDESIADLDDVDAHGNISGDPLYARFVIDGDPISDFLFLSDDSPSRDNGRIEPTYADTDGSASDMGSYGGPHAESGDTETGDEDEDGYWPATGDCDDGDALSAPGLEEVPGDGRDNDCAGGRDIDIDGDGFISPIDCDDENPDIYPGAEDIPGDGVDANCDGDDGEGDDGGDPPPEDDTGDIDEPSTGSDTGAPWVDEDTGVDTDPYEDADRDGFTDAEDCDDSDAEINPDAKEVCSDGIDNDCDGDADSDDTDCKGGAKKGCGCAASPAEGQTAWFGLLLLGLLMRRRYDD
jgi:MYXO-CTERM domain-containing protein